jgi:hypothetical protein
MTRIIRLDDGTRYVADIKKDVQLYNAPSNPPNTGSKYTSGIDLHVHVTKKHGPQFYKYHWSMWQGTESWYQPVSRDEAIEFLEDMSDDYNGFPDEDDLELLKEYGIDLVQETA